MEHQVAEATADRRRVVSARMARQHIGQTDDIVDVMSREAGIPECDLEEECLDEYQPLAQKSRVRPLPAVGAKTAWGMEDPLLR